MAISKKPAEHETRNNAKRLEQEIALTLAIRKSYYDDTRPLEYVVARYRQYRSAKWIIDVVYYRRMAWVLECDSETRWEIL